MNRTVVYTQDINVATVATRLQPNDLSIVAESDLLLKSLRDVPGLVVVDGRLADREIETYLAGWLQILGPEAKPTVIVLRDPSSRTTVGDSADTHGLRQVGRAAFLDDPQSVLQDASNCTVSQPSNGVVTGVLAQDGVVQRAEIPAHQESPEGPGVPVDSKQPASEPTDFGSHLVVVASSKGGVGKTFVATNIAELIAVHMRGKAVLIDLDFYSSSTAAALNLLEGPTINDLLPHAGGLTPTMLQRNCRKTPAGLAVLAGPERIELAELVTPEFARELIEVARRTFTYVVVDTPPDPGNELLYDLVEQASRLLVVTTPSSLTLRGVQLLVTLLKKLDLWDDERCEVVVNMDSTQSLVSRRDLQRLIGVDVRCFIQRDDQLVERSLFQGTPLVRMAPEHDITRAIRRLAGRFSPVPPATSPQSTWGMVPVALQGLLARVGLQTSNNRS